MGHPPRVETAVGRVLRTRDALGLVRLALVIQLTGVIVGVSWDRAWHSHYPFDEFVSPPHVFIYACYLLTLLTAVRIARTPAALAQLGPRVRLGPRGLELPGAMTLTFAGLMAVGFGGAADGVWHTAFGLDETHWSFPHALLAWGLLTTFLGLFACRLQLRRSRALSSLELVLLCVIALSFLANVCLGPLSGNHTPELVRGIAALPVLAADPDARHLFRIYLDWNITRTNPLFLPLATLTVAMGLALIRGIVRNRTEFLLIATLTTFATFPTDVSAALIVNTLGSPSSWVPVPIVVFAMPVAVLEHAPVGRSLRWLVAGWTFGIAVAVAWGFDPLVLAVAGPAGVAGAAVGRGLLRTLEYPRRGPLSALIVLLGAVAPIGLGVLDLWMRFHTA